MAIHLNKPYKISPLRYKKYETHYSVPPEKTLVVPLRSLGEEFSCDVRWETEDGELKVQHNLIFIGNNLVPLNPLLDEKLHELWQHYYPEQVPAS